METNNTNRTLTDEQLGKMTFEDKLAAIKGCLPIEEIEHIPAIALALLNASSILIQENQTISFKDTCGYS